MRARISGTNSPSMWKERNILYLFRGKQSESSMMRMFDSSWITRERITRGSLKAAFLLFAGYVDAATTVAQNCGGGGSVPDQNWGRDKNEDDILWARRCFRKAREMVTTPVIMWSRRR